MPYYRKLTGNRLYLSPVNTDDAETFVRWMNDETVGLNFGQIMNVVGSKDDLKWLFEPPNDVQRYGIVLLDKDILIGAISLQNINHLNRNAFIGIFIGEAEHRSKGYGAEAIRLLLNYGYNTLNLNNIMLSVHADNEAAIACYKKVGFREAGRRSEWVFKNGKYVDNALRNFLRSAQKTTPL
jgi:RimJ/RimL family protein N-acetyltransferase